MAGRLERHGGGIAGLLKLLRDEKQREAIEYDLIALGLRLDWLGTAALSWRDLLVIVRQARPGGAIYAQLGGEAARWGLSEQLLAEIIDTARILVWQQTKDGQDGVNQPQPLPRPGVKVDEGRIGTEARSIEDMQAWLAERNPNQHQPA